MFDLKDTIPKGINSMEMEIDTLGIHYLVVHTYIQGWTRSPGSSDFLERITSSLGAFYHDYRN